VPDRRSRPSPRAAAARATLVRAATELIPELGWGSVSTRVLADRAGVPPGLVHYHFASVADVLAEAAVGTVRELLDGVLAELAELPPRDGVVRLFRAVDALSGTDPASLLVAEAYLAANRDERLRAELHEQLHRFRAGVGAWLAGHGVADPGAVAALLAAALDGLVLHRALGPAPDAAALAPVALRLLADGGER
jgi:AcrR family transcriptional regulator